MNILIIEDDLFLAEKIKNLFETRIITNRVSVINSLKSFYNHLSIIWSYDIILTDIKLSNDIKNNDWYEIIKLIRTKNTTVPIIVISWNWDIDWLRYAFDCWVSDYIIKPIRLKELEIRVLNWFKNYYLSNISFLWKIHYYKDLSYNLETNQFYYKNEVLNLTKNNKYLLSIFFANPEKIISENFLVEKIWWDFYFILNRNLRVNILRLKKWLSPFWLDNWIKNIRWEWYLFSGK